MKKSYLFGLLTILAINPVFSQQKFTVQGKLSDLKEEVKIMLMYPQDGSYKLDSTVTKKGTFQFSGTIGRPAKASLQLRSLIQQNETIEQMMNPDRQEFFLYNGSTKVTGNNIRSAQIVGGKTQEEFELLKSQTKPHQEKLFPLYTRMQKAMAENDTATRSELIRQMTVIRKDITDVEEAFIRKYNKSYVSLDLVQERTVVVNTAQLEPLYEALSEEIKNTAGGKQVAQRLETAKKTDIGRPAIVFTQNTQHEQPFSLTSLKGKYVLIDFWASWCGPCRQENPNIVKVYKEFKDKNFEIVGVSLDSKKNAWVGAIEKDGLPWVHVSDLKGWSNNVAVSYGIGAVPQNFLVDPDGVIVAKNLHGDELSKKLSQLLKQK